MTQGIAGSRRRPRLGARAAAARRQLDRARRRGVTLARRCSSPPADGVAAPRGRDARAARRPRLARPAWSSTCAGPRRRAAPLPARLGVAHLGFGLGGLRLVSAPFALASLPLVALLGARLAGRASRSSRPRSSRRAGSSSSTASTAGCTACSCSARSPHAGAARALERGGRRALGALGRRAPGTVAAHPVRRLLLAAQARVRARRAARPAPRGDRRRRRRPRPRHPVLAHRPRARRPLRGRRRRRGSSVDARCSGYLWRSAGDGSAGATARC